MFGDIELVKKSCFLGWVLVEIALVVGAGGGCICFGTKEKRYEI